MHSLTRAILLLAVHLAVGAVVVISLANKSVERSGEVAELEQQATAEHRDTFVLENNLKVQKNILEGLRKKDPYVIEMIARIKHGYAGDNEVAPPLTSKNDPPPYLHSNFFEP